MNFIFKIFLSLGILFLSFFSYLLTLFTINFDGGWNTTIYYFCLILVPIMLIIFIFKEEQKKYFVLAILIFFISIFNSIYYSNYSMKIEPLIYLHNKYNIPFSDIKIIETTKYEEPFMGETIHRSATIQYNEEYILVYYDNGWKDRSKEFDY